MKKFCQCIGLASLILVLNYGDLLGGGYDVRMHVPFGLKRIVIAHIADIFILGILIFAVLAPLARTRARRWVRLAFTVLLPPFLLLRTHAELPFPLATGLLWALALSWVAFVFVLLLKFKSAYRNLMHLGDAFGIFLAVFALCSLMQLVYVARWTPGPHVRTASWAATHQPPRKHARLVWIVFDELSYDQLFEHRAPGLALPNFDALASQSTVFSSVEPIGDKTVKVLPSLLSGNVVKDYHFSFANGLQVHTPDRPGYQPLTGNSTVFADAQRSGWRTAATGWYNPYCTVFAGAIDDCYWTDLDKLDGPMEQTATLPQNIWSPLKQLALSVIAPRRADRNLCDDDVRQRYKTHIDLEQHALKMLDDDQADLVFLHLPVPHSPSVWDRSTGSYTQHCGGSYQDGLALADRELGRVLTSLQRSPRWSQTTVIVEGDHSWRSYLWKTEPAWTPVDTLASTRGFDPRPAVIVHHTGQTAPATIATPWPLIGIHTLIEQVLQSKPTP